MKIYLVGGAVRDILLNRKIEDRDYVVVGGTPEYFLNKGYEQVGNNFPVFLHPETKEEYALARKERKTGKGYNEFEFIFDKNVSLEEDLFRRDLTINAMAMDIENKEIIDPFNGQEDLKNKLINPVSEHFKEDPVRILRACRFRAKFEFELSSRLKAFSKLLQEDGELDYLTGEQVFKEMTKVFKLPKPSLFFKSLNELGVLENIFSKTNLLNNLEALDKLRKETDDFDLLYGVLMKGTDENTLEEISKKNRVTKKSIGKAKALTSFDNFMDYEDKEAVLNLMGLLQGLQKNDVFEGFHKCFRAMGKYKQGAFLKGIRKDLLSLNNQEVINGNYKKAAELIRKAHLDIIEKHIEE